MSSNPARFAHTIGQEGNVKPPHKIHSPSENYATKQKSIMKFALIKALRATKQRFLDETQNPARQTFRDRGCIGKVEWCIPVIVVDPHEYFIRFVS